MKNKDTQIVPSKEDLKFKPGFYAQISHFLENFVKKNEKNGQDQILKIIKNQLNSLKIFLFKQKINFY